MLVRDAELEAPSDDALPIDVDVSDAEQRDLPHSQAMLVDQGEEKEVSLMLDDAKEPSNLVLSEVARQSEGWW